MSIHLAPRCGSDAGRVLLPVTLTSIVIMTLGLIALTPLALDGFRGAAAHWERLSFIGQTYGAASALLAGLALVGIVATLVLHARETRNAREHALRDPNSELLRIAMENPEYRECWGENFPDSDTKAQRQAMYTNMILSQWEMAYDSRAIGDDLLRSMARKVFAGRVGWRFWCQVREIRMSTATSRRARRFHRLLDEEFHRLPEPVSASDSDNPGKPLRARRRGFLPGGAWLLPRPSHSRPCGYDGSRGPPHPTDLADLANLTWKNAAKSARARKGGRWVLPAHAGMVPGR